MLLQRQEDRWEINCVQEVELGVGYEEIVIWWEPRWLERRGRSNNSPEIYHSCLERQARRRDTIPPLETLALTKILASLFLLQEKESTVTPIPVAPGSI